MTDKSLLKKIRTLKINDFVYDLPDERIAKFPVEPRDSSKLLVFDNGNISSDKFRRLPEYIDKNSLLVYNNTRVIHARLIFHKDSGARIEVFCLEPIHPADYAQNFQSTSECEWLCLVGNLKKWKSGSLSRDISVKGINVKLKATLKERLEKAFIIKFEWSAVDSVTNVPFSDLIESAGNLPIPPYLNRDAQESDEKDYQTVFSKIDGSVAAPTAGLHFTPEVLSELDEKGIIRSEVTLHVGAGTFQPVLSEEMADHPMHSEFISVEKDFLHLLLEKKGKITAVGTTSVRTLESLYWFGNMIYFNPDHDLSDWKLDQWHAYDQKEQTDGSSAIKALIEYLENKGLENFTASTRLLIAPGYKFRIVNTIITNFHQPKSTLLLLVAAFTGENNWKSIYKFALDNDFRFLSYGDSSILKTQAINESI